MPDFSGYVGLNQEKVFLQRDLHEMKQMDKHTIEHI
jgi:hypothetical protein